jgi:hypothetical protein
MVDPRSAATSLYDSVVAPETAPQPLPESSQRTHW